MGEKNLNVSFPFLVLWGVVVGILIGIILAVSFGAIDNKEKEGTSNNNSSNLQLSKTSTSSNYYDSAYVDNVLKVIKDYYIDELPTGREVDYQIIKGYIESLNDPYTSFLTPDEAKAYNEQKTTKFEGIGITLGFENGYTKVETVIKDNPASKAGILPKDYISRVDEKDVKGITAQEVAKLIRGEKGTTVKVAVIREGSNGEFSEKEFSIVRDTILLDNIMWKKQEDGIVKIDISQFVDQSIEEFNSDWDKVIKEIKTESPDTKGVIIDLRNNPGGYVVAVRYVLEEFFKNGTVIMQEQSNDGKIQKYYDNRTGIFEDTPVVILVNEGSASASEIFASAFQDQKRGEVVGMPTVGKGVEQQVIPMKEITNDDSLLIVVFQRWLSPTGRQISKESPIKPDFEVGVKTEELQKGQDKQLDKAIDLLTK